MPQSRYLAVVSLDPLKSTINGRRHSCISTHFYTLFPCDYDGEIPEDDDETSGGEEIEYNAPSSVTVQPEVNIGLAHDVFPLLICLTYYSTHIRVKIVLGHHVALPQIVLVNCRPRLPRVQGHCLQIYLP